MYSSLFIFLLTISLVLCSVMLLLTNNRIHSILYLIFIYMSTSILFLYMGVILLGVFYFLVYIGAVAVLFLFSVMILDLKVSLMERDYTSFFGFFVFLFILTIQLTSIFFENSFYLYSMSYEYLFSIQESLKILGFYSFNNYSLILIFAGLILLVSMMGAIFLTNRQSGFFLRKQENPLFRNRYLHNISIY
jgi:NADH-quinone oxidoreductase subunit J